jgi:SAM-dependent methyltransferase
MVWDLACPACHSSLALHADGRHCVPCAVTYRCDEGIWRLLAAGRRAAVGPFIEQYEAVRRAEGRRVENPRHLLALPFRDGSRKRSYEWFIRSQSYRALVLRVLEPMERVAPRLRVLDLGSGVGWLAHRLAGRGHEVAAVDLVTNDYDGLGVHRHYAHSFLPVQAEFDRLPFTERSADLLVYNAAFHYAADFGTTLTEALRVLAPKGHIVIMDSPLYRDSASGAAMVRERDEAFEARYGVLSKTVRNEGFLTESRLDALGGELDLRWEVFEPWHGLRWWLRPWKAWVRGGREPARFKLLVGRASAHREIAPSPG